MEGNCSEVLVHGSIDRDWWSTAEGGTVQVDMPNKIS